MNEDTTGTDQESEGANSVRLDQTYIEIIKINFVVIGAALSSTQLGFEITTLNLSIGSAILSGSLLLSYYFMLPSQRTGRVNTEYYDSEVLDIFVLLNILSYIFILFSYLPGLLEGKELISILPIPFRQFIIPYVISIGFISHRYYNIKNIKSREITKEYKQNLAALALTPPMFAILVFLFI